MISYSLFSILSSLCRDFGIRVNEGKSKVLTNGLGKLKFFISIHCFLFPLVRLIKGKEYLGFRIKEACYSNKDSDWLVSKCGGRIKKAINGFQKVGDLVLVKSVLEAIPVYWMHFWVPARIFVYWMHFWVPARIFERIERGMF